MRTHPAMLMASDYGLVRTEKNRHLGATNRRRSSLRGDGWSGQDREVLYFVTSRESEVLLSAARPDCLR